MFSALRTLILSFCVLVALPAQAALCLRVSDASGYRMQGCPEDVTKHMQQEQVCKATPEAKGCGDALLCERSVLLEKYKKDGPQVYYAQLGQLKGIYGESFKKQMQASEKVTCPKY